MGINWVRLAPVLLMALPAVAQEEFAADLSATATMVFVWVAPGVFTMGSPAVEAGRQADQGPQHEVRISRGFWLGKYEVTQAQWWAVMGTEPWVVQPDHPAVNLTWVEAQAFVARLNRTVGGAVYRLPSEAEVDPAGPRSGSNHVVRGGSFGQPARNLRSAKRIYGPLDDLDAGVGLRLVREGSGPTAVGGEKWGHIKQTTGGWQ